MKRKHSFSLLVLISAFVASGCAQTNVTSTFFSSTTPQSETSYVNSNELSSNDGTISSSQQTPSSALTPSSQIPSSVASSNEPVSSVVPSSEPASNIVPSSEPVSSVAPSSEPASSIVPSSEPSSSAVPSSSAPSSSTLLSSSSVSSSEEIVEPAKDAWTIMIYMCGSDLESQYGFASEDIKEILSVENQPDDVNIIIETGGCKRWKSYNISNRKLSRYHIEANKLVLDTTLKNASMGEKSTFESFLTWGLESYPAEKTGLIIWNHGGALSGACYDDNYNGDTLLNSEAKEAFSNVLGNQKLEFIGYDCCLMQLQDIASFNVPYFNYMIASEESEAGEGWVYDGFIEEVYAKEDTDKILKTICDDFIAFNDKEYGVENNDQTLSYLDLSKMADYKTAFEDLAGSLKNSIKTSSFNRFVLENVYSYGNDWVSDDDYEYYIENGYYTEDMFDPETETYEGEVYHYLYGMYDYGTFDALDFLTQIKTLNLGNGVTDKIDNVISLLDEVVIYNKTGSISKDSCGLAIVFPIEEYVAEKIYLSSETDFTSWHSAVTASNRVY